MPGPSVPVVVKWPEAARPRGRRPATVREAAPPAYGLEVDSLAVTVIHQVAGGWTQTIWRFNPATGAEELVGHMALAACGRHLGQATGAPRPEMLEGLCADCALVTGGATP